MKLKPYNELGICPDCNETKNIVTVEIPEVYDGGLYWQCLHCPTAWHRWRDMQYLLQELTRTNKADYEHITELAEALDEAQYEIKVRDLALLLTAELRDCDQYDPFQPYSELVAEFIDEARKRLSDE